MRCHSCGSDDAFVFHSVGGIPVASNIVIHDEQEAVGYERGRLELAVCPGCGFIFNHLFDPGLVDYNLPYEESQAFSPTFRAFQDALVSRLTSDYSLPGKSVLEIGCGKGAFLEALCSHSGARGTGIDPAFQPGRIADVPVEVIDAFFDDSTTGLTADLICCRHTLEHIQPVADFMRLVRVSAAHTEDSAVMFEVPDVTRILAEGAFWDVFYEHCSYFAPVSLSWLFQATGFDVSRLELEYDDQYLVIDGRPGDIDESVDDEAVNRIVTLAEGFGRRVSEGIEDWHRKIDEVDSVLLWGAGSKAVGFLAALDEPDAIRAVVDINPFKQGSFLPGSSRPVIAPEEVAAHEPALVVIMNPIYRREIGATLDELGVTADVIALGEFDDTLV
jgi:SAM-dependent methyltransferase